MCIHLDKTLLIKLIQDRGIWNWHNFCPNKYIHDLQSIKKMYTRRYKWSRWPPGLLLSFNIFEVKGVQYSMCLCIKSLYSKWYLLWLCFFLAVIVDCRWDFIEATTVCLLEHAAGEIKFHYFCFKVDSHCKTSSKEKKNQIFHCPSKDVIFPA